MLKQTFRRNSNVLIKKEPLIPQPVEEVLKRTATIYKPAKTAMQSGLEQTRNWKLKFDVLGKFENPLIGWTSSADPVQALRMKFDSKSSAIKFCERNGWNYKVQEPLQREWKLKSYAENYKHSTGPLRIAKTK